MKPFSKCPVCGGETTEKDVEKLLRGGVNLAAVQVRAEVCLRCGERLYSNKTVDSFGQIRRKLANHEVEEFGPMGRAFRIPA